MEMAFFLLFVFLGSEICYAQNTQYQYSQYRYNQRVHPNQFSGYVQRQNTGAVRQKPRYDRVNPRDYIPIINQQKHQVVTYPKQYVRRVYPDYRRTHYKQPVQQQQPYYNPYQKIPYQRQPYQQHNNRYVYVSQKKTTGYNPNKQYQPRWPKLRGHCNVSPNIKIKGVDPIKAECSKGNVVVVFLMKRRCDFCYHQLRELNKLAVHYKKAGKPLSVVVINHKGAPLSPALVERFPGLKFYEEPPNKDLFGALRGAWRQIIVYDVCCRKQYLYGYPFCWMGYSFVRHAIFNTLYYDQVLCGVCKVKSANTTVATTTRGGR